MALLRHVHLPYSVASDEKLLETSHCLGTGGPAASRHRAAAAIGQGEEVWNVIGTRQKAVGTWLSNPRIMMSLYTISYR